MNYPSVPFLHQKAESPISDICMIGKTTSVDSSNAIWVLFFYYYYFYQKASEDIRNSQCAGRILLFRKSPHEEKSYVIYPIASSHLPLTVRARSLRFGEERKKEQTHKWHLHHCLTPNFPSNPNQVNGSLGQALTTKHVAFCHPDL